MCVYCLCVYADRRAPLPQRASQAVIRAVKSWVVN